MADRRRRRKPVNGGDSDESSDESVNEIINHTLSDLGSDAEAANSEYESADEEEILPPGAEADQENIDADAKLDDDEDRKNPQYIPKKGTFYEHDDRTMPPDEENNMMRSDVVPEERFPGADLPVVEISSTAAKEVEGEEPVGPARPVKKKIWRGDEDRWCHDKFEEVEQLPKPAEELVSVYGYDIRSEEGAPRARRRRRYGRGPNKYTRNWEDLDAYTRPARGAPVGGPRGGGRGRGRPPHPDHMEEDFPALPGQDGDDRVSTGNGSIKNQDINKEINSNITSDDVSFGNGGGRGTDKMENRGRGGGRGSSSSGGPGRKQSSSNSGSYSGAGQEPVTVQHSTHTYINQEYRRNKPQSHEFGDEERGGRGRARGGRGGAPRGGGRGRPDKPGGWKQPYGGGGPNSGYDSANRGSDDVRMLSGGGRGGMTQQQYQQPASAPNKRGGGGPHSARGGSSTHHQEHPPHHEPKHGGRGAPQLPPSSSSHQPPHSPHHQPPNYNQQPPQHSADQQQHPQQQQFPRQKRYSSQRPGRGGTGGGGGGQDMGGGTNPHYTPHPHHNLYYQDTSTTPPPDTLPSAGLAVSNSNVDAVVYSGGTVIYNEGGGLPVTSTNGRHLPPPHSVALPPPPSSQFVGTAGPPPQGPFVAQSGFLPRGTVAAVPRLFTPNSQAALLTSGAVSVVGPTTPAGIVGPVLGAPPPIMTGSAMPGAGGPVAVVARPPFLPPTDALLNPGFTGPPPATAPPQQFQGPPPHPPQFPPFQPYAAPPVPTEPAQQPQEVYRNGVMYYNTQSQQPQRSSVTLQKRPKAAIPIVPPPDRADGGAEDMRDEESYQGEVYADASDEQMPNEAAIVDPSEHYAVQQLQLQQTEQNSNEVASVPVEQSVSSQAKADDAVDQSIAAVPAKVKLAVTPTTMEEPTASAKVDKPAAAPAKVEEPAAAPAKVEEPAAAPAKVEEPAATPAKVEEPAATPAKVEEPAAAPAKVEGPAAAPAKVEEPAAAPAKVEEPAAAPAKVEEPAAAPAKVEEPAAAPAKVEEPAAAPAKVEEPAATPAKVEEPAATPAKVEEPAAAPAKVEEPAAASAKVEEPAAAQEAVTESLEAKVAKNVDEDVKRAATASDSIKDDDTEHLKDRKPVENMLVKASEQESEPCRESMIGSSTGKEV